MKARNEFRRFGHSIEIDAVFQGVAVKGIDTCRTLWAFGKKTAAIFLVAGTTFGIGIEVFADVEVHVEPQSGTEIRLGERAPKYLYHWTKASTLKIIAREDFSEPWARYGDGIKHAGVVATWPSLRSVKHGALFVWKHPVTAIKGGDNENYGDRLVRLEIDQERAKVIHVVEKGDGGEADFPVIKLADYDVIIRDSGWLHEMIILNPGIVLNFTADPEVLRPELTTELEHLKDPQFEYAPTDIHVGTFRNSARNRAAYRDYAISILTKLIENGRKDIPSYFLRRADGSPSGRSASTLRCDSVFLVD